MRILRSIAVAFAQYSRIPVPRFEWREEDMTYSLSAFPLVGAVTAALFCAAFMLCRRFALPDTAAALLLTAVPLLVTGGFHADGFMDVADALSSYRTKEEKLAILKDPHIGAFAVIRLAICGLIFIASLITLIASDEPQGLIMCTAACFVLARSLSAVSVLTFRSARNEGMLYYEAASAAKGRSVNLTFSFLWAALASAVMIYYGKTAGIAGIAAAVLSFVWYKYKSYKEFGGITGDTAGYFVVICETAAAAAAALAAVLTAA